MKYEIWYGYLDGEKRVCVVNESTGKFSDGITVPILKVRKRIHIGYTERAFNIWGWADGVWVRASRVKKSKHRTVKVSA